MIAAKPTITTLALTTANTDYSLNIPSGVNRFEIKERSGAALVRLYTTSGGGYITVPYGASYAENDVKGGFTLIVQTDTNGTTLEIKYWK